MQIVIGLLILASFMSWAIIFRQRIVISRARREADQFEQNFWSGGDLSQLYRGIEARGGATGMSSIFEFGFREFARLRQQGGIPSDQLLEGARRAMQVARLKEIDRLEHSLATLATVRLDQPLCRSVRHGLGHHECVHRPRKHAAGDPRNGGARHFGSARGDGDRPVRGHSRGDRIQSFCRSRWAASKCATRPSPPKNSRPFLQRHASRRSIR